MASEVTFASVRDIWRQSQKISLSTYLLENGGGTNIERGAMFGRGTSIELGDNSGIGINAHIHPNTKIGRNVMMGPNMRMLDSTHKFDRLDIPMIEQGVKTRAERCQVVIEDDVWIGEDVLIMSSKTIKTGSIVAARTVLCKNFPEYSIIGGNPSRLIRSRKAGSVQKCCGS